ncbi:MAG: FAD-dependent oxidoreductase [Acidobacteriota bacterium]
MDRRYFLGGGIIGLAGCAHRAPTVAAVPKPPSPAPAFTLPLVRASVDRMFRITVCLRPFRAAGPRMDVERVGEKTVVHNYGHGGSGWSLSWGSSTLAVEKAMAVGEREVAVVGCGALGLTSAILLQQAGAKVTIYAKERPHEARSSRATGSWTPDSRIALNSAASADFPALWERMARKSFSIYGSYLGMPGNPIEFTDRYAAWDDEVAPTPAPSAPRTPDFDFVHYGRRIADINPRFEELPPGRNPFPTQHARRGSSLTFNIAGYARQLTHDFLTEGGRIEYADFQSPGDLSRLPQKVIINATGYGARALWKDESIIPFRGQIAWLMPQPEVNYGVMYRNVYILGRRDGIVVQDGGIGEMEGHNDTNEQPDRAAAEKAVGVAAELFGKMSGT